MIGREETTTNITASRLNTQLGNQTRRKCPPGTCSVNASYVECGYVSCLMQFKFPGKSIFPGCQISCNFNPGQSIFLGSSTFPREVDFP